MKKDIYQEVTNTIIQEMENNPKAWESGLAKMMMDVPTRSNGDAYKGINILLLSIAARREGYSNPNWMTFKQAQELGGKLVNAKGKGVHIVFFKMQEFTDKNDPEKVNKVPLIRSHCVFNCDLIEGLPERFYPTEDAETTSWSDIDVGEVLVASSACDLKVMNQTPHYNPELDYIGMPAKEMFNTAENYYSTFAHEYLHSTGHKSRLDREFGGRFGSEKYAFEELVAELGAVFTCKQIGIDGDVENHASYLKSWLKAMKNDKKFIFKAAAKAQTASEYILERFNKQLAKQKKAA